MDNEQLLEDQLREKDKEILDLTARLIASQEEANGLSRLVARNGRAMEGYQREIAEQKVHIEGLEQQRLEEEDRVDLRKTVTFLKQESHGRGVLIAQLQQKLATSEAALRGEKAAREALRRRLEEREMEQGGGLRDLLLQVEKHLHEKLDALQDTEGKQVRAGVVLDEVRQLGDRLGSLQAGVSTRFQDVIDRICDLDGEAGAQMPSKEGGSTEILQDVLDVGKRLDAVEEETNRLEYAYSEVCLSRIKKLEEQVRALEEDSSRLAERLRGLGC